MAKRTSSRRIGSTDSLHDAVDQLRYHVRPEGTAAKQDLAIDGQPVQGGRQCEPVEIDQPAVRIAPASRQVGRRPDADPARRGASLSQEAVLPVEVAISRRRFTVTGNPAQEGRTLQLEGPGNDYRRGPEHLRSAGRCAASRR